MARVITRINQRLEQLRLNYRFRRNPAGYYYVEGVAVDSSLMMYNCQQLDIATEHVEDVLTRETGKPFKLWEPRKEH